MAKSSSLGGNALLPALILLMASPMLLIVVIVLGIFNLTSMIALLSNGYVLGVAILLNVLFYAINRLSVASALFTGVVVGFALWAFGMAGFYNSPVGQFCQIPVLGQLFCGAVTFGSILTSLFGYIAGGIILSGLVGGFLMLIKG